MRTFSMVITLFLILGGSTACVEIQPEGGTTTVSQELKCGNGYIKLKNLCIQADRTVGNYQRLSMFGMEEFWYHTPTQKLIVEPKPRTKMSYQDAAKLCAQMHDAYFITLPVTFTVPSEETLSRMISSENLTGLYVTAKGEFWTSTADYEGWMSVLGLPSGRHEGEGEPGHYQAQVFCVADASTL